MKKRGKGNTEWVEKPPGKICGEAMQLLEAERYELVSCIILPSFLVEDKRLGNLFSISIPYEPVAGLGDPLVSIQITPAGASLCVLQQANSARSRYHLAHSENGTGKQT